MKTLEWTETREVPVRCKLLVEHDNRAWFPAKYADIAKALGCSEDAVRALAEPGYPFVAAEEIRKGDPVAIRTTDEGRPAGVFVAGGAPAKGTWSWARRMYGLGEKVKRMSWPRGARLTDPCGTWSVRVGIAPAVALTEEDMQATDWQVVT